MRSSTVGLNKRSKAYDYVAIAHWAGEDRLRDMFWDKVAIPDGDAGCWLWVASKNGRHGYGKWTITGYDPARDVTVRAHRLSYAIVYDDCPPDLELDHTCRVRNCVNPLHLEPKTGAANSLASPYTMMSINLAKTHCPWGHPYSPENTRINRGERICRECHKAKCRRWRAARKRVAA
jgi:hypothetical protein